MKTGTRFWAMMHLVGLILFGYVLAELHDAVEAKKLELSGERLLLAREQELLRGNQWPQRLGAIKKLRNQWQNYVPVEVSPALARANLLSALRTTAVDAGLLGITVAATESDQGDPVAAGLDKNGGKAKGSGLPAGVQMTRLQITSRFEPGGFVKILHALEQGGQFVKIDSITIRSSQLEIGLRAYWQVKPASAAGKK